MSRLIRLVNAPNVLTGDIERYVSISHDTAFLTANCSCSVRPLLIRRRIDLGYLRTFNDHVKTLSCIQLLPTITYLRLACSNNP
jgi:hypothetical protein